MYVPEFNDSSVPIGIGSPLRTPKYAWPNWSIAYSPEEEPAVIERSELEFKKLLRDADERIKEISEAASVGCFGDYPKLINAKAAEAAAGCISGLDGDVRLLDIGAGTGNTTLSIVGQLDPSSKDKVNFSLVDPEGSGEKYVREKLSGLKFSFTKCSDIDIESVFGPESFDIAVAVAAFNNHADLEGPFKSVYTVLKPGARLIIADWHSSLPEHPRRVYDFLKEYNWDTREIDLERFASAYPKAREDLPEIPKTDMAANEMLKAFWRNYMKNPDRKNKGMLKGHRPVARYVSDLQKCGYEIAGMDSNPYRILPDSSLLMLTVAKKPS
jgi:ubiquinone/menaquinone biosynthesis C-methylase UbiE